MHPTAIMRLTPDSYRAPIRQLMVTTEQVCDGRIAITHESGYEPSTAPFGALAIIKALSGISTTVTENRDPISK